MALFDTNSGLGGLLGDLGDYGFGVPRNTGGLIGDVEREAINKRALLSGIINAGLTYAATPKNLNTGSVLPYLGKAGLAGFGASQNTVDQALNTAYRNKILAGRETETPLEITRLINERDRLAAENPKNPNIAVYEDIIKNKRATKEGLNINLGSPVAGVDPTTGQPVFFQASRTGGKPEIVPGIVPKSGEAQTKQIGGIDSLNSAIQSYKEKLKTWSPTDAADPNKRAQMKTVYNNMMLQAKEAYGLGVLNGPDYTILTDTIADPTTAKGVAYGAFGALEGQADTLSELMQRTKESLQGGKGIKPKENVTPSNQPKVIKFDSKGQRIN
jgi:hypothetical protein